MQHREHIQKWLLYALAALVFILLQRLVLSHIRVWGVQPFLYPALVSTVVVLESPQESAIFSLVMGVALDITMPGVIPCFYTLTFVIVFLLSRLLTAKVISSEFWSCMLCGIWSLAFMGLLTMLFLMSSVSFRFTDGLLLMGKEALLTTPLLPLMYLPMRKIRDEFHGD